MDLRHDVITPELALVCPELRARALAALPDRPWEAWAPARPRTLSAPCELARAGLWADGTHDDPVVRDDARGHPRLRRVALSLIVLTWIVLLSLAFLPPTDRPTVEDGAGAFHRDLRVEWMVTRGSRIE